MASRSVLIIGEDHSLIEVISRSVVQLGLSVETANSHTQAHDLIENKFYDLILLAVSLHYIDLLEAFLLQDQTLSIIGMAKDPDTSLIVKSIQLGALDFIRIPFSQEEISQKINEHVIKRNNASNSLEVIAESKKMKEVLNLANKVAKFDTSVFLSGESGTGKEILANYIHQISRSNKPFIGVNCASISKNLFESEFFGHELGAFTGATQAKEGFFESAHTGTLFLDEISELSTTSQAKLLRAIQEGKNRRVGGLKSKDINVRIISASNKCLENLVKNKEFRDDLYYRLGVFTIEIPPLRERKEDIVPLAKLFMRRQGAELDIKHPLLNKDAIIALEGYEWPGNVRELENTIERAMILSKGDIHTEHLQLGPKKNLTEALANLNLSALAESAKRIAETKAILEALASDGGNKSKSAEKLGVSYKTLLSKIKDYGLGA